MAFREGSWFSTFNAKTKLHETPSSHADAAFWACLLFHCGLSTKAIAQLPGACPIQIANQSSEKLMFYLLESGAKLDSLTLEPFTVGCMQPPVTQTSLELGMNRAKYTFPFFKDKDQPVRIAFLGGWNFKVEGSRLDSMWRTAIGLQDSPEAGIAFPWSASKARVFNRLAPCYVPTRPWLSDF
ncbi:MAG: hypothetical protein IPN20_20000 [Haliscomenobacter sp.]|nr:hypothetical protein [Haliscomenobacter sp.]